MVSMTLSVEMPFVFEEFSEMFCLHHDLAWLWWMVK